MDPLSSVIETKLRRVQAASIWTAVAMLAYVALLIAVLSQVGTPLPPWVPFTVIPLPLLLIGGRILRIWNARLLVDAARAHASEAIDAIGALEGAQHEQRRLRRDQT